MRFSDLPESLQNKITSGQPWVLEEHERKPLMAYMDEHCPLPGMVPGTLQLNGKPTPTGTPLGLLAAAMEEIAEGLRERIRDVSGELTLPRGAVTAPGNWDALKKLLGPELTDKIRNTP